MKLLGNANIVLNMHFLFAFYYITISIRLIKTILLPTGRVPNPPPLSPPPKSAHIVFFSSRRFSIKFICYPTPKMREFIVQHWLMHTASMIATFAVALYMPVQRSNNALTAAQCLKFAEKRQKLLTGPTTAEPTLGRKPQLRGFRRIRV